MILLFFDLSPLNRSNISDSMKDTITTNINSDSPYFLHSSDNPGVSIVTQSLTGENYATWSRAVRMALLVKNKYGFVNGTIERPE